MHAVYACSTFEELGSQVVNAGRLSEVAGVVMSSHHSMAHFACGSHVHGSAASCRPSLAAVRPVSRPFSNTAACRPCELSDRHPHAHVSAAASQSSAFLADT